MWTSVGFSQDIKSGFTDTLLWGIQLNVTYVFEDGSRSLTHYSPQKTRATTKTGVGGVSIKVPYFDLQLSRNWSLRSWKENTPATDLQNTYKFVYPKI